MKNLALILIFALLATMALSVSAAEISFTPFSEAEQNYIEDASASNIDGNNLGRFHDANNFITYAFPFESGDAYAQLTITVGAQYEISASKDGENFDVLITRPRGEDDTEPSWGNGKFDDYVVDLSAYLKDNTSGKIYVKIGDCDKDNGWGGYLKATNPIVFVSSANEIVAETEAPETEAPATEAPVADAPVADVPTTETPAAPATADMGIIAAVAVLAIAAGAVVTSKRR